MARKTLRADERRNWMLMAHAAAFNAVPICTAYDSLGPDGLTHSLNETEVRSMFTNADLLPTLTKVIGKCESVKLVVYDGQADQKQIDELQAVREGLKAVHIDEVLRLGQEKPVEAIKAKAEDVYCCMYTSGSSECERPIYQKMANIQPVHQRVFCSLTETSLPLVSWSLHSG
jgi:long-chain acyl-CoA synthetase